MEDPRHAVLAASRKNSGGDIHHSLKIRIDSPAAAAAQPYSPRGAGDGADADEDGGGFKESLVRKLSRELAAVDSGAKSGGVGNYHQGVVRLRSREEGEGGSNSNSSSLVERRRSQLEGSNNNSNSSGGVNQWNYADSFHNFRKDRVKVWGELKSSYNIT
jgi:hypothetical protein